MKSPLRRLRGFGHNHPKERRGHQPPPAKLDELVSAGQEVEDMRNCYDGLISAAAATTNSVYEFSEALEELGGCFLAKTALNGDDDDSGRVLMMLGKVQFELQKFVDTYRSNIIHTITTPSESLLKELQTVEEMKQQCDMKREAYEAMRASYREKGKSRHSKIESYSTEQLQTSFAEYQEDAALFIFRLKSLRQGQFHSLLTQASRHHAAQLSFFRRGLKCLEALEPQVKAIAEKQHIDYQFSGLEDDVSDNGDYSSDQDDCSDDGNLSFDYEINDKDQDFLPSRGSMDLDKRDVTNSPQPVKESKQEEIKQFKGDVITPQVKPEFNTHSAPILAGNLPDPSERFWQMKPSSAKHSYKLPTPVDDNNLRSAGAHRTYHSQQFESKPHVVKNLSHSSPLKPSGHVKMPSSTEGISTFSQSGSDYKKIKTESWSGPIPSKSGSGLGKPSSLNDRRSPMTQHHAMPGNPQSHSRQPSSVSPKMLPHPTKSPKISEIHELPRPPANVESLRPSGLVGYSGPLVSKRQTQIPAAPARASPTASQTPSPLPLPPATLTRSYSIPSNSQRIPIITVNRLLEVRNSREGSDISSPPLTLTSLSLTDLSQQQAAKTSSTRIMKGTL
ncbi:uncharacterized protein At2g33490-like isoform X1 [Panicum virgatum]|uniref:BAR domain-containing protein n=2 Tax=Panicum virgatum TaxID=38727 RepID=A0A8T0XNF6_PANVG|nr:uncharacterized protein At2g33490-like isoform X1 [Panicum virgatum]XP_039842920.1 uncharacterized protein At2g33490-like isoform X1 [Panicum virgatum]KAG2658703.1 hypothetical protein PVAP13_1KG296200 [Panicum virgatum]